jgi:hypothetical protein
MYHCDRREVWIPTINKVFGEIENLLRICSDGRRKIYLFFVKIGRGVVVAARYKSTAFCQTALSVF